MPLIISVQGGNRFCFAGEGHTNQGDTDWQVTGFIRCKYWHLYALYIVRPYTPRSGMPELNALGYVAFFIDDHCLGRGFFSVVERIPRIGGHLSDFLVGYAVLTKIVICAATVAVALFIIFVKDCKGRGTGCNYISSASPICYDCAGLAHPRIALLRADREVVAVTLALLGSD